MTQAQGEQSTSWRNHLPRARRYAEHLFALALSTGFAFALEPDYGVDNQVVYMLGSLKILDSSLYARDWVVAHTTHYHRAFEYFAALAIGLDRSGKGVLVFSILAVVVGSMALYAMLRTLAPRAAGPSFAALMLIAIATRTKAAAATYVFDHILQPSTLGSVGLLFGALYFAKGRYLASGVAIAFAGLFHGNYLVLLVGASIVAHASLGGTGLARRLALQLALPSVVVCMLLPVILRTAHSPDSARAQEIYTSIRAPHHFQLARSIGDFLPLAAWQLLGFGGAALLRTDREVEVRRTLAFVGGLATIVWGGVAASVLFHLSPATQLFPWRLAPHVALLCQLLFAGGVMRAAVRPGELREAPPGAVFAIATGAGLICLHYALKNEPNIAYLTLGLVGGAVLSTIVVYIARRIEERTRAGIPTTALAALSVFAYACACIGPAVAFFKTVQPQIKTFYDKSTILHGISKDERELTDFMRTKTPKDALFITPPGIETVRFHSQRAIIADWKSNPIVPAEVLEWYRRMGELSGHPQFNGWGDLGGYEQMDVKRLATLVAEYQPDFIVVSRGRGASVGCYATAFENARYTVLDLKKPCSATPPGLPPLRPPPNEAPDGRDDER